MSKPIVSKFDNLELLKKSFEECDFKEEILNFKHKYVYKLEDIKENTKEMLDIAYNILKENGFKPNMEDFVIEYHHWKIDSLLEQKSGFGWHTDDDGHINNSVAIMFYLQKDEGLEGGNLCWNEEEKDEGRKEISIYPGKIIMMEGRVPHIPQPVSGKGERKLIVFFFKSDIDHGKRF